MSAMGNYYLDRQTEAIRYLAAQGIDEESLWDAAEDSYHLVIGLAEMHRNNVSIDTIKRIISEAKL
jgi:predicted DNA-binding protein (MmcQ/YjbR family)